MVKYMNNNLQYSLINNGEKFISYNNIDVDLTLAFNNLSYTLNAENNKKYLNPNSLLLNIEDTDTIYNVFKRNNDQYAYQLNNILFIDNNKDMHILTYNPTQRNNMTINNNIMSFNVLENSHNTLHNYYEQTIFAYNSSDNYSYIYSNEDKLKSVSTAHAGIYKYDNNNVVLNNDKLSINIDKFNYNSKHYNTFINQANNKISDYSYNVELFYLTKKYKDSVHTLDFECWYNTSNDVIITDSNKSSHFKINVNDCSVKNIIIKDTDYIIFDIPIKYCYKSVINQNLEFNRILCPFKPNKFGISFDIDQSQLSKYISIDYSKSFIYDNKCLSITEEPSIPNVPKDTQVTDSCRVSLYFRINKKIYDFVYNDIMNPFDNKFNILIGYKDIQPSPIIFECKIDIMHKQFKKLYHNYNYGFNFDNHGECIGILYFPKSSNMLFSNSLTNKSTVSNVNYITMSGAHKNLFDNGGYLNTYEYTEKFKKDIFVNYSSSSINNIFIKTDNINIQTVLNNGFVSHNDILFFGDGQMYTQSNISLSSLYNPDRLKNRDLNYIYNTGINKTNQTTEIFGDKFTINNYSQSEPLLLNGAFIDTMYGCIKLVKYINNVVNNHYKMNKEYHKNIFNGIYNYRKSGLLYGDMYTPCVQDYLLIYLFSIENYFDDNIYKTYINSFKKSDHHFITNQFRRDLNTFAVSQYIIDLKGANDKEYQLNTYLNDQVQPQNYVWPLFTIPDYSIINSDDYIIMFSENENCEYVDYYINTDNKTTIYINYRSYIGDIDYKNFIICDENMKKINGIQITESNILDNDNDIYQLSVYIGFVKKVIPFYICYQDSDDYMNNVTINNKNNKYRILSKVYLKNEGV